MALTLLQLGYLEGEVRNGNLRIAISVGFLLESVYVKFI